MVDQNNNILRRMTLIDTHSEKEYSQEASCIIIGPIKRYMIESFTEKAQILGAAEDRRQREIKNRQQLERRQERERQDTERTARIAETQRLAEVQRRRQEEQPGRTPEDGSPARPWRT